MLYSPTNVSEETEVDTFYTQVADTIREIPKHNVLIIGWDFNTHLGQDNGYKFSYHQTTNRNGQLLNDFLIENNMICLNTKRAFTKTLINRFSTLQNRDTENISFANTRYNHFEEACKKLQIKKYL